jgi:urea transport system ATP-binding protein
MSDIAILMVEQYLEFAWRVADDYYIMAKGSIIESGRTKDVPLENVQKHITI